ncbi:hypothetical protein Cgig2_000595 [Carnegiea gigantea]|uniref:2-oxoglutarate-dependent dioxygenase DAO n=1 Tax=Carnegiea gigantea TaxID=171969 RepID=A0A9Q1GP39_9CARY|nr:hypothetical protein Cgig2_000595 [Carnegiea gigantea]
MRGQIPVVDLEEYERDPQKLREASEEWGCFRLVNHGIPTKLMAEMKEVTRDLLDLPLEIKQRNKDVIPGSGYMAPSEKNPLYEALGLFDARSSSSVSSFCSQLEASPHQRKIIEEYAEAIQKLAVNIATKLAKSMGASDYCFEGWPCQFRINKYTFTPETVGSPGVQIHTDSGFLTILQDDENLGGLEVMDPLSTSFVPVDPWPGTLVVNLGDIAVPWSNGRLQSVQHRVQCKDAGLRFSVATFLSPPADKVVEVPPEFINEEHPRMFSSFTYEEYRNLRKTTKLHAGEALQLVRLDK